MKVTSLAALATAIAAAVSIQAQSPTPIVVQPAQPQAAAPATPADQTSSPEAALQILQQVKAANDAVLAKQAATLQLLEELEKNADQLKIYSKRG
jgi:hypothetical protein